MDLELLNPFAANEETTLSGKLEWKRARIEKGNQNYQSKDDAIDQIPSSPSSLLIGVHMETEVQQEGVKLEVADNHC